MSFAISDQLLNDLTSEYSNLRRQNLTTQQIINRMKKRHRLIHENTNLNNYKLLFEEKYQLNKDLATLKLVMEELKESELEDEVFKLEEYKEFRYKNDDPYKRKYGEVMRIFFKEVIPNYIKPKILSNKEAYRSYRYIGANKFTQNHYVAMEAYTKPILMSQRMSKKYAMDKRLRKHYKIVKVLQYKGINNPRAKRNSYRVLYEDINDYNVDPKSFIQNYEIFQIFGNIGKRKDKSKNLEVKGSFYKKLVSMQRYITDENFHLTKLLTNIISEVNNNRPFSYSFFSLKGFVERSLNINQIRVIKGYKSKYSREKMIKRYKYREHYQKYIIATINNLILKLNKPFLTSLEESKEVQQYREKLLKSKKLNLEDQIVKRFIVEENKGDLHKTIINYGIFRYNLNGKIVRALSNWNNIYELNEYTILRLMNLSQLKGYVYSKIYGSTSKSKKALEFKKKIKEFWDLVQKDKFNEAGRIKRTYTDPLDWKKKKLDTLIRIRKLSNNERMYLFKFLLKDKLIKKCDKLSNLNVINPIKCFIKLDDLLRINERRYKLLSYIF